MNETLSAVDRVNRPIIALADWLMMTEPMVYSRQIDSQ
jgi:hypothetical protein